MENKNKPERMCAVCRKKASKDEFFRIVKLSNGKIEFDEGEKFCGRGLYICKQKSCVEKGIKTRVLNRGFKSEISIDTYNRLEKINEQL